MARLELGRLGFDRGECAAIDAQQRDIARAVAADDVHRVLRAIRRGNAEVGITLEDVSRRQHLVGGPGQPAGWKSAAPVDGDHRSSSMRHGLGQVVRQTGQEAARSSRKRHVLRYRPEPDRATSSQ